MNTTTKHECDTQFADDDYDAWFRAKVEQSLNAPRPGLSHQEAMAFIKAELQRRKAARQRATNHTN